MKQTFEYLEDRLKKVFGYDYFVGCSSGTAALHLALEALHLPQGSEVIVPDYTMIACARAVVLAGLTPVFVDCRSDLQIDPEDVERAITPHTKAIMCVHIYGKSCDMTSLTTITKKYDLKIVEDLAEAHQLPKHPDSDVACYSFYRNKLIAGEEGGGVGTDVPLYAERLRELRCLGFSYEAGIPTYEHKPRGHNYRLSNAHAELINKSLEDYETKTYDMLRNFAEYVRLFSGCNFAVPIFETVDSPWVFPLRLPGVSRTVQVRAVTHLNTSLRVAARVGFYPMVWQEEFRNARYVGQGIAWGLAREVIYLPLTGAEPSDLGEVKRVIKDVVENSSRFPPSVASSSPHV